MNKQNEVSEKKSPNTRSFRFEDMTVDEFNRFKESLGNVTQDQALNALLKLAERERIKALMPDRIQEINNFQQNLEILLNQFVSCVQEAKNADERAQADVSALLDSKDESIMSLQEKVKELNENIEKYKKGYEDAQTARTQAESELGELKRSIKGLEADKEELVVKTKETIKDKQNLIDLLGKTVDEQKDKIANYDAVLEMVDTLKKELEESKNRQNEEKHSHELEILRIRSDSEQKILKKEAEHEVAMREAADLLRKELGKEIQELRAELRLKQEKIEEMQELKAELRLKQ